MLTRDDERLCHQIHTTFDHVGTSDLRWTERIVFCAWDKRSKTNLITGLARYANRNLMDAYGMISIDDKVAHAVRVSRDLRPEPSDALIGPYSYRILEDLKKVRVALAENDYGLSFDVEGDGTFHPYEQPEMFSRYRGRVREHARRYYQVGRPSGWIKVDGKSYEVDKKNWVFLRDHSWGTRHGGGGGSVPEGSFLQPAEPPVGNFYCMGIFEFDKYLVHFEQREDWEGKPVHFAGWIFNPIGSKNEREALELKGIEHDFKFRPDIRVISGGKVVVHGVDGSKKELTIRPVTTYFPGPAGYDYYNNYMSGMWKGPSYIDGFKLDLSDPEVLKKISLLTETWCEVRCGNDVGYGNFEMVNRGKYPRYGFQG